MAGCQLAEETVVTDMAPSYEVPWKGVCNRIARGDRNIGMPQTGPSQVVDTMTEVRHQEAFMRFVIGIMNCAQSCPGGTGTRIRCLKSIQVASSKEVPTSIVSSTPLM
jgi:hypothetical protein